MSDSFASFTNGTSNSNDSSQNGTKNKDDVDYDAFFKYCEDNLNGYKRLLSVVEGTWSGILKKQTDFSYDDNGININISFVGNHLVQVDGPVVDWVGDGRNRDMAITGQASNQFTCKMYVDTDGKGNKTVGMMLSKDGKSALFMYLKPDNTLYITYGDDSDYTEQLLGENTLKKVYNSGLSYSKVQ